VKNLLAPFLGTTSLLVAACYKESKALKMLKFINWEESSPDKNRTSSAVISNHHVILWCQRLSCKMAIILNTGSFNSI
jgi:hypothetical protein